MYAVFRRLPRRVRQDLYDQFCALPPDLIDHWQSAALGLPWRRDRWRVLEDAQVSVCPLGLINRYFDATAEALPEGHDELTPAWRVMSSPGQVEHFVADWDTDRIQSLATAMGVEGEY